MGILKVDAPSADSGASNRFRNAEELVYFLRDPRPTERVPSGSDLDPPAP
ncbi:MAG: hypothetical protein ACRDZM_12100 [Acidimicrobiia bacterium]